MDFNSVDELRLRRKGFDNGTFSPSSIVCGNGLFIVSGKNKLAIPPSVSRHPMIISGKTIMLLPCEGMIQILYRSIIILKEIYFYT